VKDPKVLNAGVVRVKSREQRNTALEDSTRRRAHRSTERDTNLTQVQVPRGELKPLRPAFLYCTATPREAYKVLVIELQLAGGRRTHLA
jgi:hypothetical protein